MHLTVVGCSGSFPGPDSPASCYLVTAEGFRMVLDLGNGALGALARYTDLYAVDAVLLSHLHPDHCIDMCSYAVARTHRPQGRPPRLPVWAPSGAPARLARAADAAPAVGDSDAASLHEDFAFSAWSPGATYEVGPFRVTVERVAHPVETYGFRIEHAGRTLAYSGDSDACPELVRLARGAELFLCEAGFREGRKNPPGLHLTGRGAGEHAARAGAGRLVLTHVPPYDDPERAREEAEPAYDGLLELAHPGATYAL